MLRPVSVKGLTALACLLPAVIGCGSHVDDLPRLTRSCAGDGRERPAGTPDGDYYHFIRHDGRLYVAAVEQPEQPPAFEHRLGEVTCRFSGSTTPLDHSASREGEAAFLDEGTPYYSVVGVPSSQVIGAEHEGRRLVFEADLDE